MHTKQDKMKVVRVKLKMHHLDKQEKVMQQCSYDEYLTYRGLKN